MKFLAPILQKLDRIIALLEFQTFGPNGPVQCPHVNRIDRGRMGDRPGHRIQCRDCGAWLDDKDAN